MDHYSRSSVTFDAFTEEKQLWVLPESFIGAILEGLKFRRHQKQSRMRFVIMSPNHRLLILVKLLFMRPTILDAGWPLSDSNFTRKKIVVNPIRLIKNYLIDYSSFRIADLVILESNKQIDYVSNKFKISKKKLVRNFTGFNAVHYSKCKNEIRFEIVPVKKPNERWVLFRGKWNFESGLNNLIAAVPHLSPDIQVVIATNRTFPNINLSSRLLIISERLFESEIQYLYENADIAIGQVSTHERISRTIPHKAFEAGHFGVPYLTTRSPAISEYLEDDSRAIFINEVNPLEIAIQINEACKNGDLLKSKATSIKERHSDVASQLELAENLLEYLEAL